MDALVAALLFPIPTIAKNILCLLPFLEGISPKQYL
jgi:hypothetical protein